MVAPVRFPSGISTFPTRHPISTFPMLPNAAQVTAVSEFMPFQGTASFTSTLVTGTIAPVAWPGGILNFNNTAAGSSATSLAFSGNLATGLQLCVTPGYQTWLNAQCAFGPSNTDTNIRIGLFDSVTPIAETSGIFFKKSAGATTVDLIIKRLSGGTTTTTTIQNVADISRPSGIYNDTSSSVGTITATQTGGNYTAPVVATPGSGYASAPYIKCTGATGANAFMQCQIGSGSLYNPMILNAGNGAYTTALVEVDHLIDFSLYIDAKGGLTVGINGKQVCYVGPYGATALASGATVSNATSNSWQVSANIVAGLMPVQPLLGSIYAIAPGNPLCACVSLANTTGNIRDMYLETLQCGQEFF